MQALEEKTDGEVQGHRGGSEFGGKNLQSLAPSWRQTGRRGEVRRASSSESWLDLNTQWYPFVEMGNTAGK